MNLLRKKRIYLDAAAGVSANPSSPHEEGRVAHAALEEAREKIARLTEVKADDIVFTGGATEANALAILGVTRPAHVGRLTSNMGGMRVLYLPTAHASIVENVRRAEREGVVAEPLPLRGARVDIEALAKMLTPEVALVAMEAVCGETGVVWNTREVARVIAHMGGRAALHVDASQAPWTEKLTRAHFGADLMTLDASKVSVARGIGCLIASRTVPLAPLYEGGGQERGLRSGSEAFLLAKIFADDLVQTAEAREAFRAEALAARRMLIEKIVAGIPDALINESSGGFVNPHMGVYETPASQAPHILNLSLPGRDTDYIVALLDEAGFAVSTKSACETDSPEGSRAVAALFGDPERAASTLRISWGKDVPERDLARFADALIHAIRFVDSDQSA